MPPGRAAALANDPRVAYVEPDQPVQALATQSPATWGLDRIDQRDLPLTNSYTYNQTGQGVHAYIIDTGIRATHQQFTGRMGNGAGFVNDGNGTNDCHGHGTHVAGTVGALDNTNGVVGMAPGARIWPVKVLTDLGSGLNSDVICGIDYVAANADEIEVANMSLGGAGEDDGNCGQSSGDAMHTAICDAVDAGVSFVVAAGNDSADAAESTPAAYDEVITVSARADFNGQPGGGAASTCRTDQDDTFASFSNYGADVDIIAPGVCIYSTSMAGGYATLSGTSMAAPHVAGGAALYAATHAGATPAQVQSALIGSGTTSWNDADDPDNTKERLLNVASY
jgi:subtilisin family serine protease